MITKLTREQESRFPEFVEKWTRIGLSTEPLDMARITSAIVMAYGQVQKPAPRNIVKCTSPLVAFLTVAVLRKIASVSDSVSDSVRASVRASVSDSVSASVSDSVSASVRDSVSASVRASVSASVSASVRDSVRASVSDSVRASVSDSVRASVSDSVSASVSDSVSASVSDSVWNYWYWDDFGQYSSWWYSFFDFMGEVLGVPTARLTGLNELCRQAGMCLSFWDFAFVSERPLVIHRNQAGQLHKDGGPALVHSDGWGIHALNGIRMPYHYVEMPAEQIKPETVLEETNTDIRRELLRKVGIDRMLSGLPHQLLDRTGNYELFSIRLGPGAEDARYLKMVNPSVGCFHLEGVAPECDTVEKSLNWRNNNWHENAEILT